MFESPESLQETCLEYLGQNIDLVQALPQTNKSNDADTDDNEVFLHGQLSEKLLNKLNEKRAIDDFSLQVFTKLFTRLTHVTINSANQLSLDSLKILEQHQVERLEVTDIQHMSIGDIIGCLNDESVQTLKSLKVSGCTFFKANHSPMLNVVISVTTLKNLQVLDVSHTEISDVGLGMISESLPSLKSIDLSGTHVLDISPLMAYRDSLVSLSLYKLKLRDKSVCAFSNFTNLKHLDISSVVREDSSKLDTNILLHHACKLTTLTSLDISGNVGLEAASFSKILNSFPDLEFLGASLTDLCTMDNEKSENSFHIEIAGDSTEPQLSLSLNKYCNRLDYMHRLLIHVFRITQSVETPDLMMIKRILFVMEMYPDDIKIQMATSACLYNLTQQAKSKNIHPKWLSVIARLLIKAMQIFKTNKQLQKNALLTLCNDRILQDVSFDRYQCAQTVMNCLCNFDDSSMKRMSVAICSIIAAKISTDQTNKLGCEPNYMKKLLAIVQDKAKHQQVDMTMKFTLSTLWNLTDESPLTCCIFIEEGGLDLYMTVLQSFEDTDDKNKQIQVQTKVLGLLNNLAEVAGLHHYLKTCQIVEQIRKLLKSEQLDVSYFAAGIISYLICDSESDWPIENDLSRSLLLNELKETVSKWKQPTREMVAYRTFSPFFALLKTTKYSEIQYWAVWAIEHVCNKNGDRYYKMLLEENGLNTLEEVLNNSEVEEVRTICSSLLKCAKQHLKIQS